MKKVSSGYTNIAPKVINQSYAIDSRNNLFKDPDSNDGRHLLLRTEFHSQSEHRTTTTIARRARDTPEIPQSKLLMGEWTPINHSNLINLDPGSSDGSLTSLIPVEEGAFKRLQLLQGQLTRNIQHVAGLNPKAFR